jgi:hypothetical protein
MIDNTMTKGTDNDPQNTTEKGKKKMLLLLQSVQSNIIKPINLI